MRTSLVLLAASALVALGCSESEKPADEGSAGAGGGTSGPAERLVMAASTEPITLASGDEILEACQGFPFDNDETLWITRLDIRATQGMHHSDWIVLPETVWADKQGSGRCSEFVDPVEGTFGLFGGAVLGDVLFAQSTQSTVEEQRFGDGIAMAVPPRSQLFVYYHLVNTTPEDADIGVEADLYAIDEADVTVKLKDIAGSDFVINVPPREKSRFSAECIFPDGFSSDFNIYYVLPHYHYYGTGMRFEVIGGPNDGQVLFDTSGSVGEPLASRVSPAASLAGAKGLRFACDYDNSTDATIRWGAGADAEMCFFLLHSDSEYSWAAMSGQRFGATQADLGVNADGVHEFRSTGCTMLATDLL